MGWPIVGPSVKDDVVEMVFVDRWVEFLAGVSASWCFAECEDGEGHHDLLHGALDEDLPVPLP